jgi:Fe-S oxidoreductase
MLARENVDKFTKQPTASQHLRYHDTCALGRGLGIYQEPRALLAHLGGVQEFVSTKERASCSGGGGLLPTTMPEVAEKIAAERVNEHQELGGGTLVTSCASSLRSFKKGGANAVDLFDLLAAAIPKGAHTS